MFDRITRCSIGVAGDFCLDTYHFLDMSASEQSLETGLFTRPVKSTLRSLGGASNVAANLASLGVGRVYAFGVRGDDPDGIVLSELLRKKGIDDSPLQVQQEKWDTHVFTKLYDDGRELERIDFGNFNTLNAVSEENLMRGIRELLPEMDLLIINQQVYRGIHTPGFRKKLIALLAEFPSVLQLCDSRAYSDEFDGSMRKINDEEGARICGLSVSRAEEIVTTLGSRWNRPTFLTRGEKGSLVWSKGDIMHIPALQIYGKIDTVGAGDSMLAGIAVALAAGETPEDSARCGTLVAGVTVQKLNITGTATPEEVLKTAETGDYRYHPDKAGSLSLAEYFRDSEIEIIRKSGSKGTIRCAVFDHDGTISCLRQGWERVMEPMMIREIFGGAPDSAVQEDVPGVRKRVEEYIDATTGIQTISQMSGLVDMIREFGYVPEENLLTPGEYKEMYNRELIGLPEGRIARYRRGELSLEDLTMKNAVPFLRALKERGVVLYLVSGTDEEDVKNEAEALGYADLFGGGIYGSEGNMAQEAKAVVMSRLIRDIGSGDAGSMATFGDGPVEIRETRKRGGIAIGVASDEVRRYGLNPAKRTRLVLAGADLIIPDFSQMDLLIKILFGEEEL